MKKLLILLAIMGFAEFAMAQTYTSGTGISGVDKLGAHQNGGRGCVGCHAPHSGARGNGGNAAAGGGAVTDANTGSIALWGQDLGPLYSKTLLTGGGDYSITLPGSSAGLSDEDENVLTGVVMCLSCHDGNFAKGAMMTNQSYEQARGLLPPGVYGPQPIPTLLGSDGTASNNYKNDHPIGPAANLKAVGLYDTSNADPTKWTRRVMYMSGACTSGGLPVDCLQVNSADTAYPQFAAHYGSFNVTRSSTSQPYGGRAMPVVQPTATSNDPGTFYLVCTTCHTPHSMYTFSGTAGGVKGTYPTYFFLAAPYNPGAPVTNPTTASSATQFCRQCHFTGAGGSNEGSGIMSVTTQF